MKSIEKRTGNDVGASASVSSEMRLTMSKKAFLSNESNKQALIISACFPKKCRRQEFLLHTQKEMPTTKFVRWRVLPRSGEPQLKFHVIRNRFLPKVQHFILCIVI